MKTSRPPYSHMERQYECRSIVYIRTAFVQTPEEPRNNNLMNQCHGYVQELIKTFLGTYERYTKGFCYGCLAKPRRNKPIFFENHWFVWSKWSRHNVTPHCEWSIQIRLCVNPLTAKLFNPNFNPLEVVSRWRDSQLQVSENYSNFSKWRLTVFKYWRHILSLTCLKGGTYVLIKNENTNICGTGG